MIHRHAWPVLLLVAGCAPAPAPRAEPEARQDATERSIRPGVNKSFLAGDMDAARYKKRFEGESREIFVHRHRIARVVDLRPGDDVADIGAGTGLFLELFARGVGPRGSVYAVDIAPKFIQMLERRARRKKLAQVRVVHCTERSAQLPPDSIDVAFVCDTYHHFEYPQSTLASLRSALRRGGRLVIVDFERIPGKSREWVLGHVRCGKQQVIREIEAAGFRYVDEVKVAGLLENYLIRFRRE